MVTIQFVVRDLQPPVLKVMVVPWQPLKTGFAAAAWHQVSLTICFPWVAKMSGVLSWFLYLMDWFNSSCMPSSMGLNITGRVLNPRWTFMSFPPHILSTALPTQRRFIGTPTWQTTTCTIYRMGMLVLFARFSNNYVPNYQFVGITIYITVITVMSG